MTAKQQLGDLLARIHGDGGHYQAQHGTAKAVRDADAKIVAMQARGVKLGAIDIYPSEKPGKLWLQHRDGEGGHFDEAKLARVLERFFWREF